MVHHGPPWFTSHGDFLPDSARSQRPAKELGSVKRYLQEEAGPCYPCHAAVSCCCFTILSELLGRPQDTIQELVAPDGVVVRRVFSRAK